MNKKQKDKKRTHEHDNFDEFSKKYRELHNKNIKRTGADSSYFSKYKIKELKKNEKNLDADSKILDLGCGDGESEKYFCEYFPQNIKHGIDISEKSITIAESLKLNNCIFKEFDGKKIPYEDNYFDIVFVACVFHHIHPNLHISLLKEIKRVLKKNGRLYVFEHNPNNPFTRKIVNECIFDEDAILIRSRKFKKNMKKARFKHIKIQFTLFFPRTPLFKKFTIFERFLSKIPIGGQYYIKGKK